MKFEYCKNCKRECNYIEVQNFIEYINSKFNTCYCLTECPDQSKKEYTCDLVFKDSEKESTIYVEVKRVEFGFGHVNKKNSFLASQNGQRNCMNAITQILDTFYDRKKIERLDDFIINIPLIQLNDNEIPKFKKELESFFKTLIVDKNYNEFSYTFSKENGKEIKISLQRKDDNIRAEFGDKILYACDTGNENYKIEEESSISTIFKKMTDIKSLRALLCQNFCKTSFQKFPQNENPKILLNILKLPAGYDIFFNLCFIYVASEILNFDLKKDVETSATEGYLLYYCDDFCTLIEENTLSDYYKNSLIIIPLIPEMINDIILYTEKVISSKTI